MGASKYSSYTPFTLDERNQIIECVKGIIHQSCLGSNQLLIETFQGAKLALYEDFLKAYLTKNTDPKQNDKITQISHFLWGGFLDNKPIHTSFFSSMQKKWDITALGYLFEFLRGLDQRMGVEGVILQYEKKGTFRSKGGAVFTPYPICEMMADRVLDWFEQSERGKDTIPTVLDPACGGGAFLIAMARALKKRHQQVPMQEIISNHLFGIDIDEEANRICQLSLCCLAPEPNLKVIPLDGNVTRGNALLSTSSPEGRFYDIVIGNPPYVRQEKIRELKSRLQNFQSFTATADLYIYFFERGLDLLKPGGFLSYITSNSFLRTNSARLLRKFLQKTHRLVEFYDQFDSPVFDAGVTPCILTIQKDAPQGVIRINNGGDLPQKYLQDRGWSFIPGEYFPLLSKIDQQAEHLASFCDVYFCLKPGRVKDYVLSATQIKEYNLEENLFQPILRGMDVKQYRRPQPKVHIFFPYDQSSFERIDLSTITENFPNLHQYLLVRQAALEARDDYQRNKDHMAWYELRPCNYYPAFRQPKILTPDICHHNSFTVDTNGHLALDTCFMIQPRGTEPSIDFWAGFLNSRAIEFFMKMTSSSLGTQGFRYKKQFLEKIPVPKFEVEDSERISVLARENLDQEKPVHQSEIDDITDKTFHLEKAEVQRIHQFLQGIK